MNPSSHQPGDNKAKDLTEAAERRRQQLLSMGTTDVSAAPSWGERILPFILAAMEACWVDAIFIGLAGLDFFQSRDLLIPLWAPFVLIAGSYWVSTYLEQRDIRAASPSDREGSNGNMTPGIGPALVLLVLVMLFVVWSRVYASTVFVLNPAWLLSLLNDILLLNPNIYLVAIIIALCAYFCWRGVRLSRRQLEPSQVFSVLRLGLIIIVAVIIVRAGQESAGVTFQDGPTLFLLIPIFLFLSLVAHSLARATYVRRSHPIGLEGSIVTQERSIVLVIGTFGLALLLITFIVASIASPTFLLEVQGPLGAVYDWVINIFAHVIVFLVTPLYWLINLVVAGRQVQLPRINRIRTGAAGQIKPHQSPTPELLLALIPILRVALPILFALLVLALIWWTLRRRRVRIVVNRRDADLHESVWSWALFWAQLTSFLRGLFAFLFPRRTEESEAQPAAEAIAGGPTTRSIREVYRALLKRAAERGYPRKKDETPYEFRQRLEEKTPLAEPRLEVITEAYAATRYGGMEPDEAAAARVRGAWTEVEQKWKT